MKPYLVLYGAVDSFSGYGARARGLAQVLIESNKYDIHIISCKWGNTPMGFLKEDNPNHKKILDRIWKQPGLPKQPDVWIMNTIPPEMQRIGKYNILCTAGIETTICAPQWIEGCNRADLVLVSSDHAKKVFQESKFEKRIQQTGQLESKIELTSPIEVLFEGFDTDVYKKIDIIPNNKLYQTLNSIPESFGFLFVGHWLQGDFLQDRKNVGGLIKTFLETFVNKQNQPCLILKTQSATPSIMDKAEILEKINQIRKQVEGKLPNIYLLHGEFTDEEINELYNHPKVKVHVSFTKGEGFCRPLLEATLSQKPTIVSNWSGHLDFLNPEWNVMLNGKIEQIHHSAVVQDMLIPESGWFNVDYKAASKHLKDIFENYKHYLEGAKRQAYRSKTNFNLNKMGEKLESLIGDKIPQPVVIKLPSLKKIELPSLQKIK